MYLKRKKDNIEKYQELFDDAIVHTRGVKPLKLLDLRRPSEPDDIKEYRLSVYEPITKADFQRAITDAKKAIFNDKARFDLSERLGGYVSGLTIEGKAFKGWMRDIVVPMMFEDANAVIVWWPQNAGNQNEILQLAPLLMNGGDLEEKTADLIKWKVGYLPDGKPAYHQADKESYRLIVGTGQDAAETIIYEHGLGYIPAVWALGGFPSKDLSGLDYYESFFCSAFAWGNKAIRQDSDLEGAKTITAYPIREIQEEPCINPVCQNGRYYDKELQDHKTCGICHGKGVYIPSGPMAYIVKRKASAPIGEAPDNRPALSYITPPVEGLTFLNNDFESVYEKMQKALNQFKPDIMQSGIAKKIDLESKDAGIDEVAANVWHNIVKKSLEIIRDLVFWRNPESESIELRLPDTFRKKSEADLLQEMQSAKESGERFAITQAAKDLLLRKYGNSPISVKMVEVLEVYDPFFGMSVSEKMDMATAGMGEALGYTDDDFIRSGKGFNAVLQLSKEQGFLDMPINEIIVRLDNVLNLR